MSGWESAEPEINFENAEACEDAMSPLPEWKSVEEVSGTHQPRLDIPQPVAQAKPKAKKRQTRLSSVKELVSTMLKDGIGRVHVDATGRPMTIDRFFDKAVVNTVYRLHSTVVGPFLCQLRSQVKNGVTKRFRYFQLTVGGDVDKFSRFADAVSDLLYTTTSTVDDARTALEKLLRDGPKKPTCDSSGRCLLGEQKGSDSDESTDCDDDDEPVVAAAPVAKARKVGFKNIVQCAAAAAPVDAAAMPSDDDDDEPLPVAKKTKSAVPDTTVNMPMSTFVQLVDTLNALVRHGGAFSG